MKEIFEVLCLELDYRFEYGNKSHINLIDNNGVLDADKINFLMFPQTITGTDFNDNSKIYSGYFWFVMPDTFANHYKEKYAEKILPIRNAFNDFEKQLHYCNNLDLINISVTEIIDFLDANFTGLWINYTIKVYE